MIAPESIRKHENLHIVFWLIKDSCWMLELRWLGILMIIPTLTIALLIVFITRKTVDLYINLGILFWICANSMWMYVEFFTDANTSWQRRFLSLSASCLQEFSITRCFAPKGRLPEAFSPLIFS